MKDLQHRRCPVSSLAFTAALHCAVLCTALGCDDAQPFVPGACSLEQTDSPTPAEVLGDSTVSDPPRGPALSWFALRQPMALASFRYAEFSYGALGAGDINGDGTLDLLATGSGTPFGVFLNGGGFEFTDSTEPSGLAGQVSNTVALGDLDNDGDLDLVTTTRLKLGVFSNNGLGQFTLAAEIDAPEITAHHLLLVDIDNDGLLDIFGSYPPGYTVYDRSGPNRLFHNQGNLSFLDISAAVALPIDGTSWASGACDWDGDNDQDIVVANDGNVIDFGDHSEAVNDVQWPHNGALINQSGSAQTFDDQAEPLGLQGPYSSMGVVFEDLNRDGEFEIFIPDFGANKLMQRRANGVFEDISELLGLDSAQRVSELCDADTEAADCLLVSWGAAFRDFDLDGQDDLLVLNHDADTGMAQPLQLFKKEGDGYREYSLSIPNLPAHALVTGDFDNDGDLDFAASTVGQELLLFENTVGDRCGGNWLKVTLEGHSSNRQGIGATVTIEQEDGQIQTRLITSGGVAHGSLLSETHFGLGEHTAKSVQVRWPSGRTRTVSDVPARSPLRIRESN